MLKNFFAHGHEFVEIFAGPDGLVYPKIIGVYKYSYTVKYFLILFLGAG